MLHGIAVYKIDSSPTAPATYKKAQEVPARNHQSIFAPLFYDNIFSEFESDVLPHLEKSIAFHHDPSKRHTWHYYSKMFLDELNHDPILVVICSKSKLQPIEVNYLMHNSKHVFYRSSQLNITLNDILSNPINFIGRDILSKTVLNNTDELKDQMLGIIEKVLERGDSIEELRKKTIILEQESRRHQAVAKTLNKQWCAC